jgi:hypothetical protein
MYEKTNGQMGENKNRTLKEGYAHVTKRKNAQKEGQDQYVKNSLEEKSYR